MDANCQFIWEELAATDALFDEVEAVMEAEAGLEQPELRLPPIYLELTRR